MKKMLALTALAFFCSCAQGPPPPELVQPMDGAALMAHYPFMWNSVQGATGYLLEVGSDATFGSVIMSEATLDTFYDITNAPELSQFMPGYVYYWQVRSGSGENWGSPSSFRTFHIIDGGKP